MFSQHSNPTTTEISSFALATTREKIASSKSLLPPPTNSVKQMQLSCMKCESWCATQLFTRRVRQHYQLTSGTNLLRAKPTLFSCRTHTIIAIQPKIKVPHPSGLQHGTRVWRIAPGTLLAKTSTWKRLYTLC